MHQFRPPPPPPTDLLPGVKALPVTRKHFHLVWNTRPSRNIITLQKTTRCFRDPTEAPLSWPGGLEVHLADGVQESGPNPVLEKGGGRAQIIPPPALATGSTPPSWAPPFCLYLRSVPSAQQLPLPPHPASQPAYPWSCRHWSHCWLFVSFLTPNFLKNKKCNYGF